MSKSLSEWLDAYGESHQNRSNKLIHWVCVPVITWTVLALLWSIQWPGQPWINAAVAFILAALVFYVRLSFVITLAMAGFTALCIALIVWHEQAIAWPLWQTAVVLFVIAWIGQFVGHKIEGKKPSFFEDIQFLLIGPAWLMSFILRVR